MPWYGWLVGLPFMVFLGVFRWAGLPTWAFLAFFYFVMGYRGRDLWFTVIGASLISSALWLATHWKGRR
jgi:hypothetical protein